MIAALIMARDEAAIIERCIEAAKSFCHEIVVVDTGSVDGTQQLAREAGAMVFDAPWTNFGVNRTAAIVTARAASLATHLLLLDADDELISVIHEPLLPAYNLQVLDGGASYTHPRLISTRVNWRFVGVTHEYLTSDLVPIPGSSPIGGSLIHHRDGSRHERKFQEDADLLAAEYERDPTNPRTVFYLANTLRDLGRGAEALPLYRQRAAMGGWEAEAEAAATQALRIEAGDLTPVALPVP